MNPGHQLKEPADLFLLFLPNFFFVTPFQYILESNYFEILNKCVETIEKKELFTKFLNDETRVNTF